MADIELLIKIDEEEYKTIKACTSFMPWAEYLIKNGTPLPKGHGDLIDRRELKEDVVYIIKDLTGTFHNVIHESSVDDAQTIIKADRK